MHVEKTNPLETVVIAAYSTSSNETLEKLELKVYDIAISVLDYEAMLRFEPGNKQAKVDLAKLEEVCQCS